MKEVRNRHYGMFTEAGNRNLRKVLRANLTPYLTTATSVEENGVADAPTRPYECDCGTIREGVSADFLEAVQEKVYDVNGRDDTYAEVYDTVVREAIVEEVAWVLGARMMLVTA